MEEKVFFQNGKVLVSSSRVEINGQTFATRNIGSVKVTAPGVSILAIALVIVGLLIAINSSAMGGLISMAIGAFWVHDTWSRRELKLVAGGGEVLALKSKNAKLVEQVRAAIADAISIR